MNDFLDQFENTKEHERPVLLTVLCVFTWIGCWIAVMYFGMHLIKVNDIENSIYHFDNWQLEYYSLKANTVAPFISVLGTYFLWKQRKIGIFIYAFAQIIPAVLGIYLMVFANAVEAIDNYIWVVFYCFQIIFVGFYLFTWPSLR